MIYEYQYYGPPTLVRAGQWFSHCCGASYVPNPKEKVNVHMQHKGIKVWPGAVGKPYKGKKQTVDHVVTRNGTFTVSVRHAW